MIDLVDLLLIVGAAAFFSTSIVGKSGPYNVCIHFKRLAGKVLGKNSPFDCFFCSSFWIGLVLLTLWFTGVREIQALILAFGVAGLSVSLRAMSQEWNITV